MFFFLADESTDEEVPRPQIKGRRTLICFTVGCKWGVPLFLFIFYPVFLFPFIFQGLVLLKRASSLQEEAHRIEVEAQHLETEGLGKMEAAVAGSEAEGFMGF